MRNTGAMSDDEYYEEAVGRPFFTTEFAQDERMRHAVNEQSANLRKMRADASQLRSQLTNLSGNLDKRLDSLTRSFYAFVELDAIRQQLAAFPLNEQARRLALSDLAQLKQGRQADPRPDIDGYWLPPAVAALRPDGTVDASLAAQAVGRSADASLFLAAASRLLGSPLPLQGVDQLLAGETWTPAQQGLWQLVLRGGFGPDSLERATGVVRRIAASTSPEAWADWVRACYAGKAKDDLGPLTWYADQLESLVDGGDGLDDAWLVPLRDESAQDEGFAREAIASSTDPDAARRANESLLLEVATRAIQDGDSGERDLLARADLLRRQLASADDVMGAEPEAADTDRSALDCYRASLLDDTLSRKTRRALWAALAAQLKGWVDAAAATPPVAEPELEVAGYGLKVRPSGADDAAVRSAVRKIAQDVESEGELNRHGVSLVICGGIGVVSGLLLLLLSPVWLVLSVVGLFVSFWGYRMIASQREAAREAEARSAQLRSSVEATVGRARRDHEEQSAKRDALVEAAQRAKSVTAALA